MPVLFSPVNRRANSIMWPPGETVSVDETGAAPSSLSLAVSKKISRKLKFVKADCWTGDERFYNKLSD